MTRAPKRWQHVIRNSVFLSGVVLKFFDSWSIFRQLSLQTAFPTEPSVNIGIQSPVSLLFIHGTRVIACTAEKNRDPSLQRPNKMINSHCSFSFSSVHIVEKYTKK